ncbi:MAG: serine hydrolase, partial [candidate division KSB1 bacterium]|nr:serine hydrolase [candidate division KSB1 bacterium]
IPVLLPKKYVIWGHAGSTGSFMFYNPAMAVYLIGSLNQFRYHSKGIRLLFKVLRILSKCEHC